MSASLVRSFARPLSACRFAHGSAQGKKVLTCDSIQKAIKKAEYAVRGEIPQRAEQLKRILLEDPSSRPFKKIVQCNIGNPQELGQKPISFVRQVCALADYPDLLEPSKRDIVSQLFPADAIARAECYHESGMVSSGAYTHSQGIALVRKNVANFISERDQFEASADDVFLTNGASGGVSLMLQLATAHAKCGALIPIPQYPLYSATMALVDGVTVPYYLNESDSWSMSVRELERAVSEARSLGIDVRTLVVINPGNPTGQCLSRQNMEEIIDFCHRRSLVLLADEVYQANAYDPSVPFISFKEVLRSMGARYAGQELVSFHSTSKGFLGECGKRGGYMELIGIDQSVRAEIYKAVSIQLCPNVIGQIVTDVMVKPPARGEPSFDLYVKEKNDIIGSLKRRADMLVSAFRKLEGVTCNPSQGAMYSFPQIRLPEKAIAEAHKQGRSPDAFYCLQMLERTGVCTVPGSGFRQVEGKFHFRCTFLPREEDFPGFIKLISDFHAEFMKQYS